MVMGRSRSVRHVKLALAAGALLALASCNALTGASDLEISACTACGSDEAGGGNVEGGGVDGAPRDSSSRDAIGDASIEGPGGYLDTSFGTAGILDIDDLLPNVHAVAVRADGRILVAGDASSDLAAVAITPAGVVDTTFGLGGRVIRGHGNVSSGYAVTFDSQGRALVAGVSVTVVPATGASTRYAYVVRMGPSAVDTTFGSNGGSGLGSWRGDKGGEEARGVVTAAGDSCVMVVSQGNDHVFVRLTGAGVPDGAFGDQGRGEVVNVGGAPVGIIGAPGGFVSGGSGSAFNLGQAVAVAKVSLVGLPAPNFGMASKGTSRIGPNNNQNGRALALQSDDKIVVAGDYDPNVINVRRQAAATRFTSTGIVDTTYGIAGKAEIDVSEPLVAKDTDAQSVAALVDAKGRALVVGTVTDKSTVVGGGGDRTRTWVARLRADGSLDPLFGTNGKLFVGTAPSRRQAYAAALQPDGNLVITGTDLNGGRAFVARIVTTTTK